MCGNKVQEMTFTKFDPLQFSLPAAQDDSSHIRRTKLNIYTVLHSYNGWYDPFAELIQNALDSTDKMATIAKKFTPTVSIVINCEESTLTVSDNGTGLDQNTFQRFLAPHESFKEGNERGSKGVGATYLAYGFNYIRIDSKTKNFTASGEMENARRWLHQSHTAANPEVFPCSSDVLDKRFKKFKSGVSITVKFDDDTKPRDLTWPGLKSAKAWFRALSIKTALGAIIGDKNVKIHIKYISEDGDEDDFTKEGISYLSPHKLMTRTKKYEEINEQVEKIVKRKGSGAPMPSSLKNLEAVYLRWTHKKIEQSISTLNDEQKALCIKHKVRLVASYMYGATVWERIAKRVGYRKTAKIFAPGIQMAADNMPQGELYQIPLTRYTGRQNQAHIVVHFENCVVDLGRKGFDRELVDLAKFISAWLVQNAFSKIRNNLRSEDVKKAPLLAGEKIANWKKALEEHEKSSPLSLKNENFFLPINEISMTAEPSREQDVIALFNQLLAGGVIRGIKVVGTNEMMTYDGAYRVRIGPNYSDHTYSKDTNPLGIVSFRVDEYENELPDGFVSTDLKVLEYKRSLDGLIYDITTGDKKSSEIDLIIAWEAGEKYKEYFGITSYLTDDARENRQFHGVTHALHDENGIHVMDAILLKDLIGF